MTGCEYSARRPLGLGGRPDGEWCDRRNGGPRLGHRRSRAAIIWLVVALVLDGVDGPIARKLEVSKRIPLLNGNSLDLVIDYFTCVIVPVAFLDRFNILPDNTIAPTGFTILFVSALWMARTDQETPDGWFRGFPAEWNVIIPSLFLLDISRWFNLAVCAGLCVLTLSRVHFPHPVSVREQRPISLAFMFLWIGSMIWLAVAQRHITWLRVVLLLAPLWTVWQVVNRARTRNRDAVLTSGPAVSPPT
jgi:phosphatidylcholine synthase